MVCIFSLNWHHLRRGLVSVWQGSGQDLKILHLESSWKSDPCLINVENNLNLSLIPKKGESTSHYALYSFPQLASSCLPLWSGRPPAAILMLPCPGQRREKIENGPAWSVGVGVVGCWNGREALGVELRDGALWLTDKYDLLHVGSTTTLLMLESWFLGMEKRQS